MRQWASELVEQALLTLEGWGGPEGLRRTRAARAARFPDPFLTWGLPQAEGIIILALREGWKGLPEEERRLYLRLYRAAVEAGLDIPEEAKSAARRFRQEVEHEGD